MTASKILKEQTQDGTEKDILASARRVLSVEADALAALGDTLSSEFEDAVAMLEKMKGRVVVAGMGKSGHIGRKIAATLASTGTPAQFVHPAEASHGDLGMITPDDVVIALSNSGNTAELGDMIAFSTRFAIPMIGITARRDSTLADAATVALILPRVEEACPMGLAPTTSTTMMLALGDCLAVALLERKGFSPADFKTLHPGGQLGQKLLRVKDLMHGEAELPLVSEQATMSDALLEMSAKGLGCVGIVDGQRGLLGIITDGDLRRHMQSGLLEMAAKDVMTVDPTTITADAFATEAVAVMNDRKITNLFVVDGDRPLGVLHIHDCLRAGIA